MFALLTLPRGVPLDPEPQLASAPPREADEAFGIIIRPGPPLVAAPLRQRLMAMRG